MRFLMLVKATKAYEAGEPPNPTLLAAIGKLTEQTMRSGKLLMTAGLAPTSEGARIYAANQTLTVIDPDALLPVEAARAILWPQVLPLHPAEEVAETKRRGQAVTC